MLATGPLIWAHPGPGGPGRIGVGTLGQASPDPWNGREAAARITRYNRRFWDALVPGFCGTFGRSSGSREMPWRIARTSGDRAALDDTLD